MGAVDAAREAIDAYHDALGGETREMERLPQTVLDRMEDVVETVVADGLGSVCQHVVAAEDPLAFPKIAVNGLPFVACDNWLCVFALSDQARREGFGEPRCNYPARSEPHRSRRNDQRERS